MKSRLNAKEAAVVDTEDGATSARVAGGCDRVLGQELTEEGEKLRWYVVSVTAEKELNECKQF